MWVWYGRNCSLFLIIFFVFYILIFLKIFEVFNIIWYEMEIKLKFKCMEILWFFFLKILNKEICIVVGWRGVWFFSIFLFIYILCIGWFSVVRC